MMNRAERRALQRTYRHAVADARRRFGAAFIELEPGEPVPGAVPCLSVIENSMTGERRVGIEFATVRPIHPAPAVRQ